MAFIQSDPFVAEARRDPREEVQFRARAHAAGGQIELLVVNVSARGLMARTDDEMVRAGDAIRVRLPGAGETAGVVRWALGGRIGVEFDAMVPLVRYLDMLADVLRRQGPN